MARVHPTRRRTRRGRDSTIWAAVVAALVAHAVVLGTGHALGISLLSEGMHGASAPKPQADSDDADLASSCTGNAAFATSGRTAMCLAPWVGDVDRCLADAQLNLWIELSSCQARNDPRTAIAMVESKTFEKVKPIDPEKLLDDVKPEVPKPPPPQVPQPQIAQAQPPPPPPPQAAPPPPPPPPPLPKQVVETVKPAEEQEPDENTRLMSEYNIKVQKQTVSRGARNEPLVAKAKPEELTPKDKPKDEPQVIKPPAPDRIAGRNEQAPDQPGKLSMRSPGALTPGQTEQEARQRGEITAKAAPSSNDGYLARKGDGSIEQDRRERSELPKGQAGAGGGAPTVPNLNPTKEVLERVAGGGSVDRLDDVDNGDETSLSSKRWLYASFFNRLKRQVAQNWNPEPVWRRRDPTGTVYGFKTRVTEVRVSLSRQGQIARILVTTPSGVVELDEEAVRAFRAAGPFPNPPDGLVQRDNLITFAFSFAFEFNQSHIDWRMPTSM